jgi:hypothetical protein
VLADSGVQSDVKMAHLVAEPLRVHMGVLNSSLRSPEKCLEYHVLAAQGKEGLLDALWGCSKVFGDMSRLATCGFMVEFGSPSFAQLTPEDPCVLADDAMARRLSRLSLTVIRHRLRSTVIWHMFAYPGKFASLLSADVQVVAGTLTTMKADWAAWQELQQLTTPFHKRLKQRSLFRWTFVAETFQLAEQEGWQLTGKLKEQVKRSLHHFGQTKLVEDANQKLRDRERDNASQKLSDVSIWKRPTDDAVLSKVHGFVEVDPATCPEPERAKCHLPASMFQPSAKKSSMDAKDLPGFGPPSWVAPCPATLAHIAAEVECLSYGHRHGCMQNLGVSWQTCFARPGTVMRKKGRQETYVCLGDCATMMILWPAVSVKMKATNVWELANPGLHSLVLEPLLEFDDWVALPVEVHSPVWMWLHNGKRHLVQHPSGCLVQKGGPIPLLHWAAKQAFWDVPLPSLKRLAKEMLLGVNLEDDLVSCLHVMIKHILKCSDLEAMEYLEARFGFVDIEEQDREELLMSAEAEDAMDQQQLQEAQAHTADMLKKKERAAVTNKALAKIRSSLPKARGKKRKAIATWCADGGLALDQVKEALPENFRIVKDDFNGRYLCTYKSKTCCSRSWGSRTGKQCLLELLKWAWTLSENLGFDKCPSHLAGILQDVA